MNIKFSFLLPALFAQFLLIFTSESLAVPSFPGAYGFGNIATGGRGGDVYHVTTCVDSGVGSLRHGIESAQDPRTIVFDISGNIALQKDLNINSSSLTIAGQTAPGDGITLYGYPVSIGGSNIILRYLRFRCGDFNALTNGVLPSKGNGNLKASNAGALDVKDADSVIIDHVSTSWSMDEVLSVTYSNYVTVQNSIVSEALNDTYHEKGLHGFGSLIRGNGEGGITFLRNLYAHNDGRNPGTGSNQTTLTIKLQFDFANNVIYGWGKRSGEAIDGSKPATNVEINYRSNYAIANGSSRNKETLWDEEKNQSMRIYQEGNLLDNDLDAVRNGTNKEWELFPNFVDSCKIAAPYVFPEIPILSADSAYKYVLENVGASVARDPVDQRVITNVINCTGTLINSQDDVGGLPELKSESAPLDTDMDGMPDTWEISRSLDISDPEDRNGDRDSDGYTNLEEYLHECTLRKTIVAINANNQLYSRELSAQPVKATVTSAKVILQFIPPHDGFYRFHINSINGKTIYSHSQFINNQSSSIELQTGDAVGSGLYLLTISNEGSPYGATVKLLGLKH